MKNIVKHEDNYRDSNELLWVWDGKTYTIIEELPFWYYRAKRNKKRA